MAYLEFRKEKGNARVNIKSSKSEKGSVYSNLITNDPNQISRVLMDLYIQGFDIPKAIVIFNARMRDQDWIGL